MKCNNVYDKIINKILKANNNILRLTREEVGARKKIAI